MVTECVDRSGRECSYVQVYTEVNGYPQNNTVFTWWLTLAHSPYDVESTAEFTVLLIIAITAVIANILVLMVILSNKKLIKVPTHQYTAAQNVNYLLFICVAPMMLSARRVYMWTLSEALCKSILYTFSVSTFIAIWLFVFISMDRHIHVVQSVKRSRLAGVYPKYPSMAILVMVVFSVLFYIPLALNFQVLPVIEDLCTESTKCFMNNNQTVKVCASIWKSDPGALTWNIVMLLISYIIPSLLISYNYWEIYHNVKKIRKRVQKRRGNRASRREAEIQVTITCGLLVIIFLIMWTPVFIVLFLVQFARVQAEDHHIVSADVFYWVFCCTLANAVVNPLVYACMNKKFLQAWEDYRFPVIGKFACCIRNPLGFCASDTEESTITERLPRGHENRVEMEDAPANNTTVQSDSRPVSEGGQCERKISFIVVTAQEDTA